MTNEEKAEETATKTDLNLEEIQEITRKTRCSSAFMKSRFPYKSAYENFNRLILRAAQHGENSISFDFVDSTDAEFENSSSTEIEYKKNRVYEFNNMGLATCDMYSYPSYLVSKGFGVEIQAAKGNHGYRSKSYLISW